MIVKTYECYVNLLKYDRFWVDWLDDSVALYCANGVIEDSVAEEYSVMESVGELWVGDWDQKKFTCTTILDALNAEDKFLDLEAILRLKWNSLKIQRS